MGTILFPVVVTSVTFLDSPFLVPRNLCLEPYGLDLGLGLGIGSLDRVSFCP